MSTLFLSRILQGIVIVFAISMVALHASYWILDFDTQPDSFIHMEYYLIPGTNVTGLSGFVITSIILLALLIPLWRVMKLSKRYLEKDYLSLESISLLRGVSVGIFIYLILRTLAPTIFSLLNILNGSSDTLILYFDTNQIIFILFALIILVISQILTTARDAVNENDSFL